MNKESDLSSWTINRSSQYLIFLTCLMEWSREDEVTLKALVVVHCISPKCINYHYGHCLTPKEVFKKQKDPGRDILCCLRR